MYSPFTALAQGKACYTIEVIPARPDVEGDVLMAVCTREEDIYITKEQAMKFFGLVEPTTLPAINIRCETVGPHAVGTTTLPVIRVEQEDDGSYTAVTDHWPNFE